MIRLLNINNYKNFNFSFIFMYLHVRISDCLDLRALRMFSKREFLSEASRFDSKLRAINLDDFHFLKLK